MKMPIGKFKGQPIEAMTTPYLCWLVTQDNIRLKYWAMIKEALRVLRSRDLGAILGELRVTTPPPERRPTPEQVEKRKAEKAEKLRQLEQRRAEEKERRRAERRAASIRSRRGEPPPGVPLDGFYWKRAADANDISDLL